MTASAGAGDDIRRASWWGTAVFGLTAVAAVLARPLRPVALVVAVLLFAAGCVGFGAAYVRGVRRSRSDRITVAGLYLLSGSAPSDVRRSLLGALGVQIVLALATAIARPYTSLAAGTLVPVFGLGMCGLWAARHGAFPPRDGPDPPGEHRRSGR